MGRSQRPSHHRRRQPSGRSGRPRQRSSGGWPRSSWEEQTKNAISPWQRTVFFDFARRHARIQGLLVPGLYEWVVAARGVGDDNLAWEAFAAARCYPWQRAAAEIETARVDGEMLDLGTRSVRFRRRFFKVKRRLVPVRTRPTTDDPAEWLEAFDATGICSYPPEDLVVEDYGRYLKQKAVGILSAESRRSEPFSTSMLDGLDLRETLLRWHEGRVWVQELGRAPGNAGSVVAIFDEDPGGAAYPYLLSWLGEHEQESDMALYATDPTQQIVGPGIMRATYGGFMLSYPPGRLYDVWRDPDYRDARSKSDVLIMAAVDYSQEKLVVHLAPSPPPGIDEDLRFAPGQTHRPHPHGQRLADHGPQDPRRPRARRTRQEGDREGVRVVSAVRMGGAAATRQDEIAYHSQGDLSHRCNPGAACGIDRDGPAAPGPSGGSNEEMVGVHPDGRNCGPRRLWSHGR